MFKINRNYANKKIGILSKIGIGVSLITLLLSYFNFFNFFDYSMFLLSLSLFFNFFSIGTNHKDTEIALKQKTTETTIVLLSCIGLGVILTYLLTDIESVHKLNIGIQPLLIVILTYLNVDYIIRFYLNKNNLTD
jgi:uncharacterized membrane protein